MNDTIPELPERPEGGFITTERTYRFLTPVFGGGVEPKQFDPITPIRVPAIRGQLRFWWRAINPRGLKTVDELREAEAEVFGDTERRSPLSISVPQQPRSPKRITDTKLKYVTWCANKGEIFDYREPFTVHFRYPRRHASDIQSALLAWEWMGGLGARTRRGFGAIGGICFDEATFRNICPQPEPSRATAWPQLSGRHKVGTTVYSTGAEAHRALVHALQELRQGPGIGRRGPKKRSYWPEPDALRLLEIEGKRSIRTNGIHEPLTNIKAFPRAIFGLPIRFRFESDNIKPKTIVPAKKQSHKAKNGARADRWASPLILRPVLLSDGTYRAAAFELTPQPDAVSISKSQTSYPTKVREADLLHLSNSEASKAYPLMFLDPIEAFFQRLP